MLGRAVAVMCVALLSSCSLLPLHPGAFYDDSKQQTDVKMQRIADAVKSQDEPALKKLFSQRALDKATDLDRGLKYFLSAFPTGPVTWKSQGSGSESQNESLKQIVELYGEYEVTGGGKKYELYFAYFSANDYDSQNVGIYALGVVPASENGYTASGAKKPFNVWASQFGIDEKTHTATGDPGVYVPQN